MDLQVINYRTLKTENKTSAAEFFLRRAASSNKSLNTKFATRGMNSAGEKIGGKSMYFDA